jgi:hypothetical protein
MVVREWGRPEQWRATKGDPEFRDWSQRQFRFAGRGRAVTMGSIVKDIFRTTLASFALIPVGLAAVFQMAPDLEPTSGGIDPMTGRIWTIPTILGFDNRMIPAFSISESPVFAISESPVFAIGESNARLPRLLGRPVTA